MKDRRLTRLRRYLLTGLLVLAPTVITYLVLRFLYETLEGLLGPSLRRLLGVELPGIGILGLFLSVLLLGAFVSRVVGYSLFQWWERLLHRMPLVGAIYRAAQQTIGIFARPSEESFQRVCLVPFPLESDSWALGFVTGQSELDDGQLWLHVFLPTPPIPSNGMLLFVKPERVRYLSWSVAEAMQFVVSFGSLSPGGARLVLLSPEEAFGSKARPSASAGSAQG
ncbi:MAG: DUF502 domain-containing protein [Bacteroidetes bacterium]|nr:DUF502 domain-containing protein [Rhodothermia bacterium]MCS7156010.1 DUF502 domain-containing protein [Bacteroidota bacterium]MCX7907698.1 DUF502 domain-containing protein [Bacteroidota bacterium]MDW8137827.1 DUF502 domain-containing protein [Bacteroidota bacterium]MDW8286322.1 DUF502 domain-containing protein [Bacteroidota bacterium]